MKKAFILFLLILLIAGLYIFKKQTQLPSVVKSPDQNIQTPTPTLGPQTLGIFVPYWAINSVANNYDQYYYFGVSATENGIDTKDTGYQNLSLFTQKNPGGQRFLVVRMLNTATNEKILGNTSLQQKIITQTINSAQKNNFSGVVLDLEISAFSLGDLQQQISDFNAAFSHSVHQNNMQFFVTAYGDTFYRARPFDIKTIAQNADKILILAYDFHKANGDPGPNFPLSAGEDYEYDFKTMTSDFLQVVKRDKITVVFGMFGYDWPIDEKERSENQASSLTDVEIAQKFLNSCALKNCKIAQDTASSETKITYTDSAGQNHIVWFEDKSSVTKKEKYLQRQGINSFAFWAYSYF